MSKYLTINDFHGYQHTATQHMINHPQSMLWLDMGLGKLQPNSEPVLTPNGWRRMGDLRPGGYVVGSDGNPTKILSVHPQGVKAQYRITMSDGAWTRAGAEHLWYVESPCQKMRGQKGQVLTTQQLVDKGLVDSAGNRKWHVPVVRPVFHPGVPTEIDPYLLGIILGDGTITSCGGVTICTDFEILENTGAYNIKPHKSETSVYTGYGSYRMHARIKALGLAGKRSWEKRIPVEYLRGSVAQRLALLQGLLDTDGSPMATSGIEFSSTAEALVDGVVELTQSLGGVARKSGPRITQHQGGAGRPSWRVNVKLPNQFAPFRLKRKLDAWSPTTKYQPARLIANIEPDGEEESTCIMVEAEDHLYVTRNHIVTHNTVSALTAILEQRNRMEVWGTLIVAPLRVVQAVWRQESRKWAHLDYQFKYSLVTGTKAERERALFTKADVYLINFEGLPWLLQELEHRWLSKGRYLPFNQIIWDEISKMKNTRKQQGVNRGIAALKMLPFITHRIGLTGTPAGKGLLDLFGQYLVVDDGARLGTSFDAYKKTYFYSQDWNQRDWQPLPGAEAEILSRISDITISMRSDDYLNLPPLIVNDIYVELTPKLRKQYKEMEKELLLSFDSGHELEIDSAASLCNRCLQFANGACYKAPGQPEWENIHDLKMDALDDIVEEAAGKPILVMYEFQHDAEKIMKKYPAAKRIHSNLPEAEFNEIIVQWNAGRLPMLIGHPMSIGHGLNIQAGSNLLVWYGLNWSLELYLQAIARLRRQGQQMAVIMHRIMTRDTWDEVVRIRLASNEETEQSMRSAIEEYRSR